jgi:excinuclease ABC subunit A
LLKQNIIGYTVFDILDMTVDEARSSFQKVPVRRSTESPSKTTAKIQPLADVGLGYIRLGQKQQRSEWGEAQRIKLASWAG